MLEIDPYAGKPLRGKLLEKWSIRSGDYRVIYTVDEKKKNVMLQDTQHRKKVYK